MTRSPSTGPSTGPSPGPARPRLVLATTNPGKVTELRRILGATGLDVELVGLDAFPPVAEVAEDGATFVANALAKARGYGALLGQACVADDSGLCVDALGGAPGVRSARWSAEHGIGVGAGPGGGGRAAVDRANLALVLGQVAEVPDGERGAHFACAAAVVVPGRGELVARGRLDGTLLREPRGTGGFGYDPVFLPTGETRTTAEMPPADKDAISHRGVAFRALAAQLADLLGGGSG